MAAKNETASEPTAGRELVTSRVFDVTPERMWKAWTDPAQLSRWWGPSGFTDTVHEFNPTVGGDWRHTMHGPDGKDYPNHAVFRELAAPTRIVLEHVTAPHFFLTATFDAKGKQTLLTFRQLFDTRAVCDSLRKICEPANEQNLDRLAAELKRM